MNNAEMQPHVTMEYRPYEGRVIRIEGHQDRGIITPPALELRPISPGVKPAEGLIAGLIAAFSMPYGRRTTYAQEGWNERKAEWEKQQKLADIRSQLQ